MSEIFLNSTHIVPTLKSLCRAIVSQIMETLFRQSNLCYTFFEMFADGAMSKILAKRIFKNKVFKSFAIVIQAFCLIINLNILNQLIDSYWLTTAIGLVFIALMYPRGLLASVMTDQVQGVITYAALIGIICFGFGSGAEVSTHIINSDGGVLWALWSACILLTSPFGDVQMWQRARVNSGGFWWATLFFGLYMVCIFVMSMLEFSPAMNVMLLVACLAVTTSTIDSIAVAMHEVSNKKVGTALAVFLCLFWGVFKEMGIVELWSTIGIYRVAFCVTVLFFAIKGVMKHGRSENKAA